MVDLQLPHVYADLEGKHNLAHTKTTCATLVAPTRRPYREVALLRLATFSSFRTPQCLTVLLISLEFEGFFGMSKKSPL